MFKPTLLFIACTALSSAAFSQQVDVAAETRDGFSMYADRENANAQVEGEWSAHRH